MTQERHWVMWAHEFATGRGGYRHFGSRHFVELHGLPHPAVRVEVVEDPEGDYWGWLATGAASPSMIWPSEAQFSMCFTYGPKVEVERGKGVILRLRVLPYPKAEWDDGTVTIHKLLKEALSGYVNQNITPATLEKINTVIADTLTKAGGTTFSKVSFKNHRLYVDVDLVPPKPVNHIDVKLDVGL